ncbi:MAG TPA: carbohydrate ABC transporter substrate-binding protein [Clostridiaceae bacterium]|nr:carbohydrate ABC transporter substrate-binding protein [Clostridiaceae bacterium]
MKKLRKTLCALIAVLMSAALFLTACSTKVEVSQKNSNSASDTQVMEPKMPEPVTLRYVTIGPSKSKDYDKVIEEFNKKLAEVLPNTTVEIEPIANSEYKQKWDLMMAAGEEIDIAWTGYLVPLADEVAKGSYMALDELYNMYGTDIKKEVPEWFIDMGRCKGKLYCMPTYKDTVELKMGMYTPHEYFEKYWDMSWSKVFLEPNTTYRQGTKEMYDVFEEYMRRLKEAGKLQSGFSQWVWLINSGIRLTGTDDPSMIRLPLRGQKWDLTVRNYYELPEVKLMYETMADWYKKGYIRKDILSLENPRAYENITSG